MSHKILPEIEKVLRQGVPLLFRSFAAFCLTLSTRQMRSYQQAVAQAVLDSILMCRGNSLVVIFPRQSGKNELQAHLEAYLLALFSFTSAEMVKVSPTWKPQTLNAMRRLERALQRNLYTSRFYQKESGHIFRVGQARIVFLSGAPTSHVVGATANTLLECDEAQDILIEKWDREFAPMAASTNATRLFFGTAWTKDTLLARELRLALSAEKEDGIRRAFVLNADQVAQEVPAYGKYVAQQIARLGRNHPMVKTQYFSEEIDSAGGMFTSERLQLMQGFHPPESQPHPGADYAFCFDLGGSARLYNGWDETEETREHDASALTIFRLDFRQGVDGFPSQPLYRVVERFLWVGLPQDELYARLLALAECWQPRRFVLDASGMGMGLADFLGKALPGVVLPFVFTRATKSSLGWGFLALVEGGRYKEYAAGDARRQELQELFYLQAQYCQMQTLPGVERHLQWGVPEGARHPHTGKPLHDDLLISAALCTALERQSWGRAHSAVIVPPDPLQAFREAV